jgi:hypothetical protein
MDSESTGGEHVFVQARANEATNANTFAASEGFRLLGRQVQQFDAGALESIPLTRATVVCGYVGIVHRALERLGVTRPRVPSIPAQLGPLYGREIRETTLGAVREDDVPVFIKPLHDDKVFPGHVRGREIDDLARTAMLPDRFEVIAAEVVVFASEWRCFVLRGEVLDARRYAGSFRTQAPDWSVLDEALRRMGAEAPAGYAIDLGVTADGRTCVVEVNDGYSLGCYGLAPLAYARLLDARWQELCETTATERRGAE